MPGVTYERQVQFTTHGPVAIHVMVAPKPGGLWSLEPALSNGALIAREPTRNDWPTTPSARCLVSRGCRGWSGRTVRTGRRW
jgi:hypothetical protein